MRETFDEVNPGDIAVVWMEADGSICEEGSGTKRQFPIIGCVNDDGDSRFLVCYGEEHLYSSSRMSAEARLKSLEDTAKEHSWFKFKTVHNFHSYDKKFVRFLDRIKINALIKAGPDGCNCKVCKEFYDMAVPNQPDGKTLICWSCRQNPMRAYY